MNLRDLSLTDLTKLRRDVLAAIKAKYPRASRPKPRKVRDVAERDRARLYAAFREEHCIRGICWRCDAGPQSLDRAHITKDGLSKRCEDVRLVNALCIRCHMKHTGGEITTEEMLRLKREHDPDNYDPEFLQLHSIRKLVFP